MASHLSPQKIKILEIAGVSSVALYAVWSLARIIGSIAPDFSVLYQSAANLVAGRSLYADASLFTGLGYPAVSLLPFLPFTLLSYPLAQGIWIIGSFLAFLGSVNLSLKLTGKFSMRVWAICSAIALLAFPTKFTIGMGQTNYFALFFLLLGLSDVRMPHFLKPLVLAISLLLKPHLIFVYLGLLFTKYRAQVGMSIGVVGICVLLTGMVTGWVHDAAYVRTMVPHLLVYRGREIYYNQGIGGFVSRLFGGGGEVVTQGFILLVVAVSIFSLSRKKITAQNILTTLLPMQILVEPLAWQHHLVFLLPAFVLLWEKMRSSQHLEKWIVILCYLLIGWNIKNPLYWQGNVWGSLVLSHGFAGCLLIWYMSIRYL